MTDRVSDERIAELLGPELSVIKYAEVYLLAEEVRAARERAEWNVRQHDGRLIDEDLDGDPYTEETARAEALEYVGGVAVRRLVGPWEPVTEGEDDDQ